MMYEFKVILIRDNGTEHQMRKEWTYKTALEAVSSYNLFVDHGFACCGQSVFLLEPNGTVHSKEFLIRGYDDVRARLGYTTAVLN